MNRKEVWRKVPGYPGVRASSYGRLWLPEKTVRGRTYRTTPTQGSWSTKPDRYILMVRGMGTLKVARLVCLAFKGLPPPGKPYCLHKDEDASNNKPGNLEWGTQKANLNAPGFLDYCSKRTGENNPFTKGRKAIASPATTPF